MQARQSRGKQSKAMGMGMNTYDEYVKINHKSVKLGNRPLYKMIQIISI